MYTGVAMPACLKVNQTTGMAAGALLSQPATSGVMRLGRQGKVGVLQFSDVLMIF